MTMHLSPDSDQQMMIESVRRFVDRRLPISRVRELRDQKDDTGFSRELWKEMAGLGWVGLNLPEEYGGSGLGFYDLCLVLEQVGRTLNPEPFLSSVLLGAQALILGGTRAQKAEWLPKIATGDAVLTVAYQEADSRYDLERVRTTATADAEGVTLSGTKIQVLDGHVADRMVVSACTNRGISLFLVDPRSRGVTIERQTRVDSRNAAIVRLDDVHVTGMDIVGILNAGGPLLASIIDRATIGLCAEMLGAASEAFDLTLGYLKDRVQFGVPIGSFQALQHRAARLFIELELARSALLAAARTVDEEPDHMAKMASLVKVTCSETFMHVANEGVQIFGGVGMTDEYDIGFYIKRARAADVTFGDVAFHRARWADLHGY
jgi:acyl-CoA dehydrogenase